ncbi:hypothetical protein BGZ70_006178 [Mortierella alpina]|uniref:Zinc finger PHD-type domain-containing protein n=1 Tax=Mortierella alpina TaxID=64518 RepID=A0A9P6JAB0_MORAP|nr:hypothetical protein BGZ70_006178 [Mortierella alpina]
MASPRRSNRGGHSKGRKKEEEDDGGQTRCVCNQQHHEGVMIQCETCKVWQHCPCVGLGDGEVTPDKYYCDSCRPENHPYRVQNGQLIINSSAKPSSTQKPTKKRSTMNSKEASIPMDLMLAQQKWNEEHQDEIEDDITQRASSKRRRKTESVTTDIDEEHPDSAKDSDKLLPSILPFSVDRRKSNDQKDKTGSAPTAHEAASPRTPSNHSRSSGKKSAQKSTSKAGSRSNSPVVNGVESRVPSPQDTPSAPSMPAKAEQGPSSKNGRSHEDEESKNEMPSSSIVPATKRRKTSAKSDIPSRSESASADDQDESTSKKEAGRNGSSLCMRHGQESIFVEAYDLTRLGLLVVDVPVKSRKNGSSSRTSHKKSSTSMDDDPSHEDSATPSSSVNSGQQHQQVPTVSSPASSSKKAFPRRGADRQHMRTGSRHTTPTPNINEGTPQPMIPAAPATVRYPSPKMTIQDMTKRAKQLLDYISRVQIDMADRKSKSGSNSPQDGTSATPRMVSNSSPSMALQAQQADVEMGPSMQEFSPLRFPAPSSVSTTTLHGDSQVCPDLSRSSMDSTASAMDSLHEPSSPLDMKVPSKDLSAKEMTIKVVPMDAQERSPLLSTPPLSVHDHHHHHHRHQQHRSGSPESETTHEPLTPPHQPLEGVDRPSEHGQPSSSTSALVEGPSDTKKDAAATTSLDLLDKLTGDLIRFQEKFGAYA